MSITIHVGVFHKKYADLIFNGRKTIESRISTRKIAPHGRVASKDVVLIKVVSGPIVGHFQVRRVKFFELHDENDLLLIKNKYNSKIVATDDFWMRKRNARFATLLWIDKPTLLENPVPFPKRDRRTWIVLGKCPDSSLLIECIPQMLARNAGHDDHSR